MGIQSRKLRSRQNKKTMTKNSYYEYVKNCFYESAFKPLEYYKKDCISKILKFNLI